MLLCLLAVVAQPDVLSAETVSEPQDLAEPLETLRFMQEETVVTASRLPQPISQAPSNMYVVTDEDIRQSGATDLPTVLRRIPGLEVMQVTGADFNVSVRGNNQLQANKLLVMVDGRAIYNDAQGFVLWKMVPVTLPEIKRIEVLKGPASVLYGFNAFDGVINIITKAPEEMRGTTLQFGGGELGTISSAAVHAGTAGKLGYRLSIGREQNQQWRDRDSLAFRAHKFHADTQYQLSDEALVKVSGGMVDANRFDGIAFETSLPRSNASQGYANASYERSNLFLRAWWMQTVFNSEFLSHPLIPNLITVSDRSRTGTASTFTTNTYNVEGQHSLELAPWFRFTYGVNFRHNTLSSNFIERFTRENRLGLYVQNELSLSSRLKFISGVRYDMDTFINPTWSPRGSVVWSPVDDHTFRASVTVGFRPPTLVETRLDQLLSFPLFPVPPQPFTVNPDLKPESIISYEVGYQGWFLKHRLRVRTDLFANLIRDLMDPGESTVGTIQFQNAFPGKAKIYGVEGGVEFLATPWLSGFANVSFQNVDQSFVGTVERVGPPWKANVGLRGEWESGLSGEAAVHFVDATSYPLSSQFGLAPLFGNVPPTRRQDSYTLLNVRAGYRFWEQKAAAGYLRNAEVAISVFNALNDRHKEHPVGDTIGSRVMAWLTVRL